MAKYSEADYYLDHYGNCALGRDCRCIKPGAEWLGRLCPNWLPWGCKNFDEMMERMSREQSQT